ncbi:MAG: 3-deoxy-8-phosphooctulonate synthase [Phycisphaeraceae bacterium]|nr:3-deoxy-8-phosphooctulonate synthase [Phycisphaeraceae bacterium]MCB9848134.1 3-deoxy-8-phosphooctulonate synthase [Phycisphaeraceae bacterium]
MPETCLIGDVTIGDGAPLAVIAGPCALEGVPMALEIGTLLRDTCRELGLSYVFKASFDKANRTSVGSRRGPGIGDGLAQLARVREALGVPVVTDVHEPAQAEPVAAVVDCLQVPAFLCRQTDLLIACGEAALQHGRAVSVKKGQFLSPEEMAGPIGKLASVGCRNVMLIERGTFFGYHRLVNDFLGLGDLMELRVGEELAGPVCFDCTHSTQLPGATATTGGRPERAPLLARAAVAAGVHAVFLECHPEPARATSDAATMLRLEDVPGLLRTLAAIDSAARGSVASGSMDSASAVGGRRR